MKKWMLTYSAASEKGSRDTNQDNLRVGAAHSYFDMESPVWVEGCMEAQSPEVFCVCDGIGGEALGDVAAMTALDALHQTLSSPSSGEKPSLTELVLRAIEHAQSRVFGLYRAFHRNGGCTLSLVAVHQTSYVAVNIGDSPIFLAKNGGSELEELSCRHTLGWKKRDMGLPTQPGDECCLMRYIGKPGHTAVQMAHVAEGTLEPEDCLLLCTDGVTDAFPAERLRAAADSPEALRALVKQAAEQEHSDNCTAICLKAAAI